MMHPLPFRFPVPIVAVVALAIAAPTLALVAAGVHEDEPAGKTAFVERGCQTCHSVSAVGLEAKTTSERMKGPDLSAVGETRDAAWIRSFVLKETEDDEGREHRATWKGSEQELEAIADWLVALVEE